MKTLLSLVIPCYNEEMNIEKVLRDATRSLEYLGRNYEIIVVNDGSSDKTAGIVSHAAQKNKRIKVITHPENRGYGAAIKSGLLSAEGSTILMVDGDGQFDMRELSYMTKGLKYAEVVIGYRIKRHDSLIRRVNSFIFNWTVRIFFGLWVRDVNCSMKGFRNEVIDKLDLVSTGALINVDILTQSMRHGYRIVQTPVHHFFRAAGKSTGSNKTVIFRSLFEFWRLFIREFPLRYKEFSFRQRTTLGFLLAVLLLFCSDPSYGIHFVAGLILASGGVVVRNWAAGFVKKTKSLACSGPYSYVRHPLYMGSLLIGIGSCLMVSSRTNLLMTALFWSLFVFYIATVYWPKIIDEEKNLQRVFVQDYEEYMRTVPRYFSLKKRCVKNQVPFDWAVWRNNREYNSIIGFSLAAAWIIGKL